MDQLKRLRVEKGLSQARLAARASIDPSTVNQIERGAREASPATLRKLAEALDVSLAELLEETNAPKGGSRSSLELSFNGILDAERRYLRYVQSWMVLLDRKAQRWEEVAATGHVERGFHREVSDDFADVVVSLGVLVDTLESEGLHPASAVPVIGQEFLQRLERFAEATHKVDRAIEKQLDQSELERARARRAEGQMKLEEVRNHLEQQAGS
jgi:transcriptional regulator with XRE-family HTH domain